MTMMCGRMEFVFGMRALPRLFVKIDDLLSDGILK
jgi:hypothetical protein